MSGQLTLALLEQAPDRQTAELLLISAMEQGVDVNTMRRAWSTWQHTHTHTHTTGGPR